MAIVNGYALIDCDCFALLALLIEWVMVPLSDMAERGGKALVRAGAAAHALRYRYLAGSCALV